MIYIAPLVFVLGVILASILYFTSRKKPSMITPSGIKVFIDKGIKQEGLEYIDEAMGELQAWVSMRCPDHEEDIEKVVNNYIIGITENESYLTVHKNGETIRCNGVQVGWEIRVRPITNNIWDSALAHEMMHLLLIAGGIAENHDFPDAWESGIVGRVMLKYKIKSMEGK